MEDVGVFLHHTFLVFFGVVGGVGDGSSVAKMWISHPPSVVQLGDCESPSLRSEEHTSELQSH